MKKAIQGLLTLCVLASMTVGCANRWREGDVGKSSSQVGEQMEDIRASFASDPQVAAAFRLYDEGGLYVYYSESPSPLGPNHESVMPLDLRFIDSTLGLSNVKTIRAYFLDRAFEDGSHQNALILEIEPTEGTKIVKAFVADAGALPGGFDEDSFVAQMSGTINQSVDDFASDNLVVRSDDVEPDEDLLQPVIQLELSMVATDAQEISFGKISTLVGYYR